MKYLKLSILLVIIAVLTIVAPLAAQEEESASLFRMAREDGIFEIGQSDWDRSYNEPGAVIYYEGQFHMLRNGVPSWPAAGSQGYIVSDDGINWTAVSNDPVFTTADVPYAEVSVHAGSVVQDDDGTWVLFFYAYQNRDYTKDIHIGRATAPDLAGPWTPDEAFILEPGSDGEWDDNALSMANVVRTENEWLLYYTATGTGGYSKIGLATSPDGQTWTKYDDSATTEAPFAESDPVLVGERADENNTRWEYDRVEHPLVEYDGAQFTMIYKGSGGLGVATSEDGRHWTKYDKNPVFQFSDTPTNSLVITRMVHVDDTYYLYFEGQRVRGGGQTTIYVATYTGDLPPTE